nr:hypothetical protein [candidate division Zixibacteria bacterium]
MCQSKGIIGFLVLAIALYGLSAFAQVPQTINYQGHLLDDLGSPVSGSVAMTFSIYDEASGGTQIWTQSFPAVNVVEGGFTVILGDGDPIEPDVFNSSDRWLEVIVDGQPINPRVKLTSMPYAQKVATIEGAQAGSITGTFKITPGTKSDMMAPLHTGTPLVEIGPNFTVDATNGRPGSLHLLDINSNIAIDIDGQDTTIGIGLPLPAANLHVNGDIYTLGGNGDITSDGNINALDLIRYVDYLEHAAVLTEEQYANGDMDGDGRVTYDDMAILMGIQYGALSKTESMRQTHRIYGTVYTGSTTGDAFFIQPKAGIATSSPKASLHVNGDIYTLGGDGDIDLSTTLDIADLTVYVNYLYMGGSLTKEAYAHADVDGDGRVTPDDMSLATLIFGGDTKDNAIRRVHGSCGAIVDAGTDAFYVRGDLGVGTAAPAEKVQVFWANNVDAEVGRGTTNTSITFLSLRNANGTKCYIYPDPTGTVLMVSTTKP